MSQSEDNTPLVPTAEPDDGEEAEDELNDIAISLEDGTEETVSSPLNAVRRASSSKSGSNDFLIRPVPQGTVLKCHVRVSKSGFFGSVYPRYEMYFENTIVAADKKEEEEEEDNLNADSGVFILGARKVAKLFSSKYIISSKLEAVPNIKEGADYCVGVLNGTFYGNKFVLSGGNDSPTTSRLNDHTALIFFKDWQPPRQVAVVLPRETDAGGVGALPPSIVRTSDFDSASSFVYNNVSLLMPKWPTWNNEEHRFVQDYFGRCTAASARNFQMAHVTPESPCDPRPTLSHHPVQTPVTRHDLALLSGAVDPDENRFSLDVAWPLSPLQAFGVFLASSAYKLSSN